MKKMNPVVHFEMPAEDKKRMVEFYARAFGWQAQQLGPEMGNYVVVTTTELGENQFPKEPGRINGGFFTRTKDTQHPNVVIAVDDARLGLIGNQMGLNYGLQILQADRPYRAAWTSSGLDADGWTRPARVASVEVVGGGSARVTVVSAKGRTRILCGTGDIPLPTKATGTQPPLPLGPGLQATVDRTVGVRLTNVAVGAAC